MTELDRLLERVTVEPAYGPAFYHALLTERVFALIPLDEYVSPGGRVRLIMWTGEDGVQVIPFFSNTEFATRALPINPRTQGIGLLGKAFLEASRGATVVLNPNEQYSCRLSPNEVALLLETGSPNEAAVYEIGEGATIGFSVPHDSSVLLNSLVLLLSQIPEVDRAYLATLHASESQAATAWLLAAVTDSDEAASRLSRQLSAMLVDAPLAHDLDLLQIRSGSKSEADFNALASPFYRRELGSRIVLGVSASIQ
jgi:hypothetical protein